MNLGNVERKNQDSAVAASQILYQGLEDNNLTRAVKEMNEFVGEWVEGKRRAKRTVRKYAVEAIEDYLNNK